MDISNSSEARQPLLNDSDEVGGVLNGSFYSDVSANEVTPMASVRKTPAPKAVAGKGKNSHYKVICISMYLDSLQRLDDMVKELKSRGYTKANRSALIRHALDEVDLDSVPRGL